MQTNLYTCKPLNKASIKTISGKIKILLILFLLCSVAKFSSAECPGHNSPSCNFYGPLVACVGTSTMDTIAVSYGSVSPEFAFKFLINGAGGNTNGIVTPFGGFQDSTFQGTVIVNAGPNAGPMDIQRNLHI